MKATRILALLLALVLLAAAFVGCKKDTQEEEAQQTTKSADTVEDDNARYAENGDGKEFMVLTRKVTEGDYTYKYEEIGSFAEEDSDRVTIAVYDRDMYLNETFNITITALPEDTRLKMVEDVREATLAGLQLYDAVMMMAADAFALGMEGLLYEIDNIPYVNMEKEYWNSAMYNTTSIGGYNFMVQGSANISAYNAVGVTYFNKQMITDLKLENPYELVKSNTWTFEKMKEMCLVATSDSDGLQGMDYRDTYGLAVNNFVWQPFFYASGNMLVTKQENDVPAFITETPSKLEVASGILAQISSFLNDSNATLLRNHAKHNQAEVVNNLETDIFMGDRSLFYVENVYGQVLLREMETDYGILPMPKWDVDAEFVSYAHAGHSSVMVVPLSVISTGLSGAVIEELAYHSHQHLLPEFYEQTIRLRGSRDEESYEMLGKVFENVVIDLALVMESEMGMDNMIRMIITAGDTSFATNFQALKNKVNTVLSDVTLQYMTAGADQYQ